jgi:sigma-B regulation protein RsbU (phosphoserine phosphatase)
VQTITVQLDEETIRYLTGLGPPGDVLAELARSTAASGTRPGRTEALVSDQREANTQMVRATIRAQELAAESDAGRDRAEASEQKLRAVAEFRELFIGILGHDLRTPVGSMTMAADLLLQGQRLDARDSATASLILRNGGRITRMITQLLDLTRARLGGGLPIDLKPINLADLLRHVVEEFDTAIHLDLRGDLAGTWDQDRLAEVLSNLVGNAIQYAAPRTEVVVAAWGEDETVIIEVTNQGDPIPLDVLPFIFEPFRRAKQHEKSSNGNLGLGLYIADQIVLAHGGTLEARSADRVTTFIVRLPRHAISIPPPSIRR